MDFARPDLLWLLYAVPVLGLLAWWSWRRRFAVAVRWASRELWARLLGGYQKGRPAVLAVLFAVALLGTLLALARPRWGTSEIQVERRGVDMVFVLDTSLSMATQDVAPNRLWVAQTLVRRLVRELPGHRVALVQAEGEGLVQVPLTADADVLDLLLDSTLPGSLPVPGTRLARSLELALQLFPPGGSRHQVVVLVSDGEDHDSNLAGMLAKLRMRGIVVHAIGVGTPEGKPLEIPRPAGRSERAAAVEYKRDLEGNVVVSKLIEKNLEAISNETGGVYVRATSAAAVLDPIRKRIESMATKSYGNTLMSTLGERFQWPLGLAIAALGLQLLIAPFRRAEGVP